MKVNHMDGKTRRNRFTRMCIGDALIQIMNETSYHKVTIMDICNRAGVSRRTYYNYYITKEDIIFDYMNEIMLEYNQEYNKSMKTDSLLFMQDLEKLSRNYGYEQILYSIDFFAQYNRFIKTLVKEDLEHMLYQSVNMHIKNQLYKENKKDFYESTFIIGAFLNTYITWIKIDETINSSELAMIINNLIEK